MSGLRRTYSEQDDEHVMVLKPAPKRNGGETTSCGSSTSGDDRFTFLVTIKPSPPTKRKVFPVSSAEASAGGGSGAGGGIGSNGSPGGSKVENEPSEDPREKSFGQVLQDLMDQLAAPAEKELDEQMRASGMRAGQLVRQGQEIHVANPSLRQKHVTHFAQPIPARQRASTPPPAAHTDDRGTLDVENDDSSEVGGNSARSRIQNRWRGSFKSRQAVPTATTTSATSTVNSNSQSHSAIPRLAHHAPQKTVTVASSAATVAQPREFHNEDWTGSKVERVPISSAATDRRRWGIVSDVRKPQYPENRCLPNGGGGGSWGCCTMDKCAANQFQRKSNGDCEELQDKLRRLENDKQTLAMQVSVLTDQVEAHTEKARDMETLLRERRDRAERAEDMMQREALARSSLENQKMELVTELANLRLKMSGVEKEKILLEERLRSLEAEVSSLRRQLGDRRGESPRPRHVKCPSSPYDAAVEMEKLKRALESVMAANDEKDRKIEELRSAMIRYRLLQERLQPQPTVSTKRDKRDSEEVSAQLMAILDSIENIGNGIPDTGGGGSRVSEKPPVARRSGGGPTTSTPTNLTPQRSHHQPSPSASAIYPPSSPQNATEEDDGSSCPLQPETPPSRNRVGTDHYGTVPRSYAPAPHTLQAESTKTLPSDSNRPRSKTPLGKDSVKPPVDVRSCSAPNLALTEVGASQQNCSRISPPASQGDPKQPAKTKGFRKIFGKLGRSNSQTIEDDPPPGELKRGGVRATAGARLGWSRELRANNELPIGSINTLSRIDVPFARWDSEQVSSWLHNMGLSAYVSDCRRWVRSGDHLLHATPGDLEKELGIRNHLHRKKLQLALQAVGAEGETAPCGLLDHQWVTRWLDDMGLPQYKDTFSEARVDGRMLNYMTVEDLTHLKVVNLLHVISLKQGIQVLRLNNFSPTCLRRRPTPNEARPPSPEEVALWTNHRVMEWLRSVDLSEYAPNLRGSGVHGALMVLEPRFGAELLAALLSIPQGKTLLRRHLSTHFKELVGADLVQGKREIESEPGFAPLTPTTKVKVTKKSQFSRMRKRSRSELELDEFVCPMDSTSPVQLRARGSLRTPSPYENSASHGEQEVRPRTGSSDRRTDRSGNWGCI